jgi:myo-inositol-1(or 4)-monophosphatase
VEGDEFERLCGALGDRFGDLRRLGCAQAALAMVASGELDGVVGTRPMAPWDTVAGAAMIERAGGTVTDPDGEPWHHAATGLVASNGTAHGTLLETVEAARD